MRLRCKLQAEVKQNTYLCIKLIKRRILTAPEQLHDIRKDSICPSLPVHKMTIISHLFPFLVKYNRRFPLLPSKERTVHGTLSHLSTRCG